MKNYVRTIISLLCLSCASTSLFAVSAKKSQEIESGNYARDDVWLGAGWYGETWIDTEADFDDWWGHDDDDHRDHDHDYHHDDRRDHDDHHH
jgi:hypothetical protein